MTRATMTWALTAWALAGGCGDDGDGQDATTDTVADEASGDTLAPDTNTPDSAGDSGAIDSDADHDSASPDSADGESPDTLPPDAADVEDSVAPDGADTVAPDSAPADVPTSDVLDGTVRLVGAGWSFGECLTGCRGALTLEGASLAFEVRDNEGVVEHATQGILTTEGAAELDTLLAPLVGEALQLTYGCPDCNDGGASSLDFTLGAEPFTTTYERGEPPAILADLDAFTAAIMGSLRDCETTMRVVVQGDCGPPPER